MQLFSHIFNFENVFWCDYNVALGELIKALMVILCKAHICVLCIICILHEFWILAAADANERSFSFVTGDKIPGGSTLLFDVELLQIEENNRPRNVFKEIDSDKDNLLSQDEVCIRAWKLTKHILLCDHVKWI